jgi:sulfate permease, SulP family
VASEESRGAVVILRLRGADDLGSTIITALLRYRADLEAAGCSLLLCGVGDDAMRQLRASGAVATFGESRVFAATPLVSESLTAALEHAHELTGGAADSR